MEIAYAAHTESCTFMLDANGVCRWVVATSSGVRSAQARSPRWEKSQQAAERCIGAQYVASLDVSTKGGLLEMPRVGVPMLFARVDPTTGRVTLVRTAPILRFETKDEEPQGQQQEQQEAEQRCDASDSGMRHRPDPDPTEEDVWDIATRPMRRDEVWHEVEPDELDRDNERWEVDTETAKVDLHPSTYERMRTRPRSDDGSGSRDVYTSAPPTRVGTPAYSRPVPRAPPTRPIPRASLPPSPSHPRTPLPPLPAPGRVPSYGRAPRTPLPPQPGYSAPRTPAPMPPPRRVPYDDVAPPQPIRQAPQAGWAERPTRPPLRRAR